jgi:hypothetical protein
MKEDPLKFKNLKVYPEYRCQCDNITVEESLTKEDKGHANYGFVASVTLPSGAGYL